MNAVHYPEIIWTDTLIKKQVQTLYLWILQGPQGEGQQTGSVSHEWTQL